MAAERQSPDAVVSSSGLDVSGGIAVIQDDPDAPDANWFTHTAKNGSLRVSFPTPTGDPTTGADVQEFRVQLRKDASGGSDPTYTAELRETGGGAALQTLATDVAITTTDPGEVESLTWDAANLATADGSAVELLLTFTGAGGGPNERSIEVGAVEWNVEYSEGSQEFQQSCPATVVAVGGLSRSTATAHPAAVAASPGLAKQTATSYGATATASAGLTRQAQPSAFAVTTSNVATLDSGIVFLQEVAATVSAVASLATQLTFGHVAAVVVSATASLKKQVGKSFAAVSTAGATLQRSTSKVLGTTAAAVADLATNSSFLRSMSATVSATAALVTGSSFAQSASAAVSAVASLVTEFTAGGGGEGGGIKNTIRNLLSLTKITSIT